MTYELVLTEEREAKEVIRDDAFEIWLDMSRYDESVKEKGSVAVWYNARKGIQPQTKYVYYEFVEIATGEMFFLNAGIAMNNLMIKHEIYPKIILEPIKEFKNKKIDAAV